MNSSNLYKIAVLGDSEVGKSTICKLMSGKKLDLLEISCQDNTQMTTYQGIRGVFIVVDLFKISTFGGAIKWKNDLYDKYLRELEYYDETIPIILLFNKADNFVRYAKNHSMTANLYNDEITYSDCEEFCDKYGFPCHFYTSSKSPQSGVRNSHEKMIFLCGKTMFPSSYYDVDETKTTKIDLLLKELDEK